MLFLYAAIEMNVTIKEWTAGNADLQVLINEIFIEFKSLIFG